MKRKRRPGKLTYSELVEAGHTDLAEHVLSQRIQSILYAKQGYRGRMKLNITPDKRFLRP